MQTIEKIVSEFTEQLSDLIETAAQERAMSALSGITSRGGKLAKSKLRTHVAARRKGPIQLCPVPGCKMRAAPVFGMVCSNHKDLPKAKIKKFREARRNKKVKASKK